MLRAVCCKFRLFILGCLGSQSVPDLNYPVAFRDKRFAGNLSLAVLRRLFVGVLQTCFSNLLQENGCNRFEAVTNPNKVSTPATTSCFASLSRRPCCDRTRLAHDSASRPHPARALRAHRHVIRRVHRRLRMLEGGGNHRDYSRICPAVHMPRRPMQPRLFFPEAWGK